MRVLNYLGLLIILLSFSTFAEAGQTPSAPKEDGRSVGLPADTIKSFPSSSKRFALIIGVDKYADTQISTLGGASNDASTLANALVQYAGFPADQVTLLASDQPLERQPTRGNILRRLSNMSGIVPRDGLLLVSFAGHGIERDGQAFLLPADAQVSNDRDLLEQTAINVLQIKERIRKTRVDQVLIILDACRNDPAGRANADNPLTTAYTHGFNFERQNGEIKAFATLYATEVGCRAYEYKEKHQGYFTWALVEALKGGAANQQKEVTLAGLIKYLQERVPKRVAQDLGPGKAQRPFAIVEGYRADELVVAVAAHHSTDEPAVSTAPATTPAATPGFSGDKTSNGEQDKESNSLTGTMWSGNSAEIGAFTIRFLEGGKYSYTTRTGTVFGKWQQSGTFVQLVMANGYSVLDGNLERGLLKIDGTNREGVKWHWTLIEQRPEK